MEDNFSLYDTACLHHPEQHMLKYLACRNLCHTCGQNGDLVIQKLDEVVILRCRCHDDYTGSFCDVKIGKNIKIYHEVYT